MANYKATPLRRSPIKELVENFKKNYSSSNSKDSPLNKLGLMQYEGKDKWRNIFDPLGIHKGQDDSWKEEYDTNIQEQVDIFKGIGTENLYAGATNKMGSVRFDLQNKQFKNQFKGFENKYQDLGDLEMNNMYANMTVDQRASDFMKQQQMQQQANIMQGLQGAAGGSGIAALAQTMAQQGQLQAQQAAAGIGQQEREIKMKQAGAGMDIQRMQEQRKELIARGGMESQMARMQGAQSAEQMLSQREQAVASGQFQASQARAQGAMQVQGMQMQGATDARNLEFQKSQGLMSFYAGQKQAEEESIQADKSWLERTFG